ncbi:MAG: SpoIIIAH-like family protein, partial [Oscillospiraceae bacterium]|nr:SpoIIIAH-like family protein [Oscillospiraceae bacterium]
QKEALAKSTQTEAAIEALLAARGLPEALCTVREGSVNVVVKTNQLPQQQAAQILDIVMAESGEAAANVKIIPAL